MVIRKVRIENFTHHIKLVNRLLEKRKVRGFYINKRYGSGFTIIN